MKTITVLNNQSLLDIAIRHCGTIEAITDIAILNNLSITDELTPGQTLKMPLKDYGSQNVVNFFQDNKKEPATALSSADKEIIEGESGIDFWIIEDNFIVQ